MRVTYSCLFYLSYNSLSYLLHILPDFIFISSLAFQSRKTMIKFVCAPEVTAPPVTVKSDVWKTFSTTDFAFEGCPWRCWCSDALLPLLSSGPLSFMVLRQGDFWHEQSSTESLPPPRAVLSQIFPAGRGNAKAPEIILADILESQIGATNLSLTRRKLCLKVILRYSSIIHSADMAQPSETTLSQ